MSPTPRDLDPKFTTTTPPDDNTPDSTKTEADKNGEALARRESAENAEGGFIVLKRPGQGDVRMPMAEWAKYERENGI